MGLYRERGVVLRTWKLGEADRIIVLFTAGRGKVRAVAKGVRRTKSRFGGRLEPGTEVSLLCYEGRELDIINQADTLDHFPALRSDLERMTDALALLEAVEAVAREGHGEPRLYRMLTGALRTLDERPAPLLVAGFYWKLLALEGVSPVLDSCAHCGSTPDQGAELVAFDPLEGGTMCRACRRGRPVTPGALELVRAILGGDLGRALAEPPGPVAAEVADLATHTLENHLERRLRTVRMLGH